MDSLRKDLQKISHRLRKRITRIHVTLIFRFDVQGTTGIAEYDTVLAMVYEVDRCP